jgi:L-2-hydroxyglutarate oxidase
MGELYRSLSKKVFTEALQQLVPEVQESDLVPAAPGIRAQACGRNGDLLDDFCIVQKPQQIHVLNAPSPAATSSLAIGQTIANMLT